VLVRAIWSAGPAFARVIAPINWRVVLSKASTERSVRKVRKREIARPVLTELERKTLSHPAHLIKLLQQKAWAFFLDEAAAAGVTDMTPPQFTALLVISEHPDIEQLGLGQLLGYDRTTSAGLAERLEEKNLIRRKVADYDRRARNLSITPLGIKMLARLFPVGVSVKRRLLQDLSKKEQEQFVTLLARMVAPSKSGHPSTTLS
jgi:DNA-binding MarR family transcriptional regulator